MDRPADDFGSLSNGDVTRLTDTTNDEAPSFASNGKYILYATRWTGARCWRRYPLTGGTRQVLSLKPGRCSRAALKVRQGRHRCGPAVDHARASF